MDDDAIVRSEGYWEKIALPYAMRYEVQCGNGGKSALEDKTPDGLADAGPGCVEPSGRQEWAGWYIPAVPINNKAGTGTRPTGDSVSLPKNIKCGKGRSKRENDKRQTTNGEQDNNLFTTSSEQSLSTAHVVVLTFDCKLWPVERK